MRQNFHNASCILTPPPPLTPHTRQSAALGALSVKGPVDALLAQLNNLATKSAEQVQNLYSCSLHLDQKPLDAPLE